MANSQVNANQIIAQAAAGMVTVAAVSIISQVIGIAIAGAAVPVSIKVPLTKQSINDMKSAFGADVVNTAIQRAGTEDILFLAAEVEDIYITQMGKKYGLWATIKAIETAPSGDLRAANEIAKALSDHGVSSSSSEAKIQQALGTGKKRAARKAQPVKDTHTGIVHHSKASAGMAVASDYGLSAIKPDGKPNSFIWYEVIKRDPERFVEVRTQA